MHVGSGDCGGVAEGLGAVGVGGVWGVVCAVDLCGVLVGRGGVELGCGRQETICGYGRA